MNGRAREMVEAVKELHRRPTGYRTDESFTCGQVLRRYAIVGAFGVLLGAALTKGDVPLLLTSLGGPASAVADGHFPGAWGWLLFILALLGLGIVGRRYFLARFAGYIGIGMWFWWSLIVMVVRAGV